MSTSAIPTDALWLFMADEAAHHETMHRVLVSAGSPFANDARNKAAMCRQICNLINQADQGAGHGAHQDY